jgi:hypothetical protein
MRVSVLRAASICCIQFVAGFCSVDQGKLGGE